MIYTKDLVVSPEQASRFLEIVGQTRDAGDKPVRVDAVDQNEDGEWVVRTTLMYVFEGGPYDGLVDEDGPDGQDKAIAIATDDNYCAVYMPDPRRPYALVFAQLCTEDELADGNLYV